MPDDAGSVKVTVQIRRATPYDFVNIMRMSERMWEVGETLVEYPKPDMLKVAQLLVNCKANGEILVADCSRQIVGVLALQCDTWPWSDDRIIVNRLFHVLPNFRSRGTAEALLQAAQTFADASNLKLMISFSGGRKAEVKDRMMQMRGWVYLGGVFCRPPLDRKTDVE